MHEKTQLLDLYRKHLIEYLDERYMQEDSERRCMDVLKNDLLKGISSSKNAEKINKYVTTVMAEAAAQGYKETRSTAIEIAVAEFDELISDLFTDDELKQISSLVKTDTGAKLLRNFDLFRDAFEPCNELITANIVNNWNDPDLLQGIVKYVESLDNTDSENFED